MGNFSIKEYIRLDAPTEELPISDHLRIEHALNDLGYTPIHFPLKTLQKLYPLCRNTDLAITVTLVHREHDWIVTNVEAGDQRHHHYGLAVDYGSTTIVMQLVDLNSGCIIAEEKAANEQIRYGTDILTRITYAIEDNSHIFDLQLATVSTFHLLLDRLTEITGIDTCGCSLMVISGNTTMVHFLLGLNAWPIFAAPYAPITSDPGFLWGSEIGLDFQGLLYIIPSASNYVGGDIVSGILALGLHKKAEISMFFDIGTNGELVIGNKDWLLAGAGAAGPALEGYISRFGMRAASGAIDSVTINKDGLSFTTIGALPPVGICGSGIIDLIAQMRNNGWINIAGILEPSASDRIVFLPDEQQYVAVYATADETANGNPLYFSQTDILQYLDTKAAAYTMIDCLLQSAGLHTDALAACYLSGAFSAHSNLESAITVGIFPDIDREKYHVVTNSSLDGARAFLLEHNCIPEAKKVVSGIYCVQFASIPDFIVRMQAAKFIPHTDLARFPSIMQ